MSPRGVQVLKSVLKNLKCRNPKMPYYAVARGREVGVYLTWDACYEQTTQYRGAKYKKFDSKQDAWNFVKQFRYKSEKPVSAYSKQDSDEEHSKEDTVEPSETEKTEIKSEDLTNPCDLTNSTSDLNGLEPRVTYLENKVRSLEERIKALENRPTGGSDLISRDQKLTPSEANQCRATLLKRKLIETASEIIKPKSSRSYSTLAERRLNANEPSLTEPTSFKSEENLNSSHPVPFKVDSEGHVQVYTDGACSNNNGSKNAKAGVGVWFNDGHPMNVSAPVQGRAANNVAEIQAATTAVQVAAGCGITKLCIITDSQFTINCMTSWIHTWKKNDWKTSKGHSVINKEEVLELEKACKSMESVKWVHVKGHDGTHGNERADELARAGAECYVPSSQLHSH